MAASTEGAGVGLPAATRRDQRGPSGRRVAAKRLRFVAAHGPGLFRAAGAKMPAASAWQRARDVLAGYDPLEASWYRQARGHTDGCVSNFHREEFLRGVNGYFGHVLDNKHLFALAMRALGLPHPELFGHARSGTWRWTPGGRDALERTLAMNGRVVVKPSGGKKGQGVRLLARIDELDQLPADDVIATSFVAQAGYAAAIHAASLNTIRVLTLRPRPGGEAFVAAAVHRFGGTSTGIVDNFSAGGIVAEVDLGRGTLSQAAQVGSGNRLVFRPDHPDSGTPIAGAMVPHWDAVKTLAVRICEELPHLDYVGWDIAVTEAGPVLIEGNSHPSLRFFQLYRPLLDEPRVAAFFAGRLPAPALRPARP